MTAAPLAPPVAVYRFYDAHDQLLYVGITDSPGVRFGAHRAKSAWWAQAVRNTIAWYDTRDEATNAESEAIATESPLHNVAGPVPVILPTSTEEFDALPRFTPKPYRPRRPRGQGALFYRPSKGYWVGRLEIGIDREGRRQAREVSSKDRATCERKLDALKAELGVS